MSWSKCIYLYHKEREGQFLGNSKEGELILNYEDAPLTVNFYLPEGRYGVSRIQACTMVDVAQEYELTVGAQSNKALAGLKALLRGNGFDNQIKRGVSSSDPELTEKLLSDEILRAALENAPQAILKVRPGPDGTHLLKVYCLSPESPGSAWPFCADDDDYAVTVHNEDEIRSQFFPQMDNLLALTITAKDVLSKLK